MNLGFSIVIGKSEKGECLRNVFATMIYEESGSYTEYKKLSRRKISSSMKYVRFHL